MSIRILCKEEFDLKAELLKMEGTIPRGYFSASQFTKYLNCGESYRYHYEKSIYSPPSEKMAIGSVGHELVELHIKSQLETKLIPEADTILESLNSIFSAVFSKVPEKARELSTEALLDIIKNIYTCWYKEVSSELSPVSSEETAYFLLDDMWPIMAKLDYINLDEEGRLEIVDLKVGKMLRDPKNSLQLGIYSLSKGINRVSYDTLLLPGKRTGARRKKEGTTLSEEQLGHIESVLSTAARGIAAKIYLKTTPDFWGCSLKYCSAYERCRGEVNKHG